METVSSISVPGSGGPAKVAIDYCTVALAHLAGYLGYRNIAYCSMNKSRFEAGPGNSV
jgi:hypothetical protein